MARLTRLLLIGILTLVASCGSDRLPTNEVTGKVNFSDGIPVPPADCELDSGDGAPFIHP